MRKTLTGKARIACQLHPLAWQVLENVTLNGIVAHEDWLPTFAAAAGEPQIKEKLAAGTELIGRKYRNMIDGYNQLDYLMGKTKESPRKEFMYVNDEGQIVAIRLGPWKAVFLANRGVQLGVWQEPFVQLRIPYLFNLRRDPFEKAQENSNTYWIGTSTASLSSCRCKMWLRSS